MAKRPQDSRRHSRNNGLATASNRLASNHHQLSNHRGLVLLGIR
jgi:hypothetical protein